MRKKKVYVAKNLTTVLFLKSLYIDNHNMKYQNNNNKCRCQLLPYVHSPLSQVNYSLYNKTRKNISKKKQKHTTSRVLSRY